MISPVPSAMARSEQLLRNAVCSGTRGGAAASRYVPGRNGLPAYRFVLSQAVGLSAQPAGSQNNEGSRFCDQWSTPGAEYLNGIA